MENHARAIEEIQNAMLGDPITGRRPRGDSKPPFWPILSGNDDDGYKLRMIKGWVCARHLKHAVNSVVTIEVTDIPGDPDPDLDRLTVATGDKVYCKVTENVYGEATAAAIESGASWPTSDAPELIGGTDQTGANGTRYIRLCEIVTVDDIVKAKVLHTGHIDHFAPVLVENMTLSPGTGEARVYKKWDAANGTHDFRYLVAGNGTTVTEGTNTITIAATATGLPSGTTGDTLYYNGSAWVVLAAPTAPGTGEKNIMVHNGTAPSWLSVDVINLGYCSGGSPTTGDFLKF